MPDHTSDIWDCPNPFGGCEDTENPGWYTHCPICGAPKEPDYKESGVDRDLKEEVQSFAHDINDITMTDTDMGIRALSESIKSEVETGMTHYAPRPPPEPNETMPWLYTLHGFGMVRSEIDESRRSDGRLRDDTVSDVSTDPESSDSGSTAKSSGTSPKSSRTSATSSYKNSGFSVEQIQKATRVFVSILQQNELLAPLYKYARNNTTIGPNKLRRHLRGALKTFASNLEGEANDLFEIQVSSLMHAKAHHAARRLANEEDKSQQLQAPGLDHGQASEELEDSSEDSSEDEMMEADDAAEFRDLKRFCLFLTESGAYATLQADIRAFCTKQLTSPQSLPAIEKSKLLPSVMPKNEMNHTWHSWKEDTKTLARGLLLGFDRSLGAKAAMFLLLDLIFLLTDDILIASGWLEPPLEVGWTRIRSDCVSLS